jgi:NitT/TauT family transport system ATP-binding protein
MNGPAGAGATPAIAFEGVIKVFELPDRSPLRVLDGLSFEISRGAFISILGPSGCGKSTILHLMAGLDRDYTGRIVLASQPEVAGQPGIGFVFQQPRLLNWRTVADNVVLPIEGRTTGRAARRDVAIASLRRVGLEGCEDLYPLSLSAGMQQRVAIARALVIQPWLLLMDEPFSSLDEITARRMRDELVGIWQDTGKTIVFVTHSIREAVFLSEHILMLTRKPARIHRQVRVDLPYPRRYDDRRLFEVEAHATREFLEMDQGLPVLGT